jgi:hypothetical protein
VVRRLREQAVSISETDPVRARGLLEAANQVARAPESFSIERVLEMPGVKDLAPLQRESLRSRHSEHLRLLRENPVPRPRVTPPRIVP